MRPIYNGHALSTIHALPAETETMINRKAKVALSIVSLTTLALVTQTNAGAQSTKRESAPKPGTLKPVTEEKELQQKLEWYQSPVSNVGNGDRAAIDGREDLKPMMQAETMPDYSKEALKARVQGTVKLAVIVNEAGMPENVQVLESPDERLAVRAAEAIRKWRWRPGYEHGQKVKYGASVEFTFRLIGNAPDATSAKVSYTSPVAMQKSTVEEHSSATTSTSTAVRGPDDGAGSSHGSPIPDLPPAPKRDAPDHDGVGNGDSAPMVLNRTEPEYSPEAHKARLEGMVALAIVVDEQGVPQNIRVVRSLGLGLDEKAVAAVQKWRFRPAMRGGHPVRVKATIEINFRLLDNLPIAPSPATPPIAKH